jgi:myo-inositol-1(or 4)-monophosphatase
MIEVALAAAQAGARVLREQGLARRPVELKGTPGNYVTAADHASEEAILEVLADETSGIPVLAEERGGLGGKTMWAVDPLDGTTNFSRGCPVFCVSVGLLRDGVPEVGAVVAPWLDTSVTAQRGKGAWLNGERLPALSNPPVAKALVTTCFPYRERQRLPQYEAVFQSALRQFEDLRRNGAFALDLAWTAAGIFDGTFALSLGPWDVIGAAAALLEVGGVISDWSGNDGWLASGDVLAGPPEVHEHLVELASQSLVTG